MQNRIKVIISDLDGTLLNQHHTISEYTKAVFKNYIIRVSVVGYGRHHLDALPIIAGIGCPIYLVTSNGARIHSPKRTSFSLDISSEVIKSVLSLKSMQNSRPWCLRKMSG
jgi:hydroxymethylpyrimidine pyrophosphatase-like HAD family hydrolase